MTYIGVGTGDKEALPISRIIGILQRGVKWFIEILCFVVTKKLQHDSCCTWEGNKCYVTRDDWHDTCILCNHVHNYLKNILWKRFL